MVGRKGTDEAKQAAREARKRRETRKRYGALLGEHPAIKAMRSQMAPRVAEKLIRRGVPRMITAAMQDEDVVEAVTAIRRIMKYHHRSEDLVRRRLQGERIALKDQISLIRQGEKVERDFQQAARLSCAAALRNLDPKACASGVLSHPDDTEVLDNFPAYLTRNEKAALRYMGIEPDELTGAWDSEVKPRLQKARKVRPRELTKRLRRVEESANQLEYPQAPHRLVKQGILTLGGDDFDDWLRENYWVLVAIVGFAFIVLAIACLLGAFGPHCVIILTKIGVAISISW